MAIKISNIALDICIFDGFCYSLSHNGVLKTMGESLSYIIYAFYIIVSKSRSYHGQTKQSTFRHMYL